MPFIEKEQKTTMHWKGTEMKKQCFRINSIFVGPIKTKPILIVVTLITENFYKRSSTTFNPCNFFFIIPDKFRNINPRCFASALQ